jgi:DNA-directed RNA polymerase I and III subunit RPAC1
MKVKRKESKNKINLDSDDGHYEVTESGLKFRHSAVEHSPTRSGQEFLARFSDEFSIRILEQPNENELVFEMIGVDVSFANALRRILISEVPTMAIEMVYMADNTSIIHDEVLAHRLGLVPINVDARFFDEFEPLEDIVEMEGQGHQDEDDQGNAVLPENATDRNTIVFTLNVKCSKSEARSNSSVFPETEMEDSVQGNTELDEAAALAAAAARLAIQTPDRPYTKHVYSRDLEWVPQGDQEELFSEIRPVHEDILLAKLRPGQRIDIECHARKGVGKDHAKFSPVATASYRLMPKIEVLEPIYDELAEELVHLLEPGVFSLKKTDKTDPPDTRVKAVVTNPYACTMSRNFMRNKQLAESIRITRIPNHVIFSVESVGMQSPGVLVAEALRVLQSKCQHLSRLAVSHVEDSDGIER